MRNRYVAILLGVVLAAAAPASSVKASPADDYHGPYFGENNFPPGCTRSAAENDPTNICHRMRTGLNALDSPQVDVLVMVPASPTAERDMRIMRQSVEMWEAGIDHLADEMDLDWLADGVDFHVTIQYVDPTGGESGEFSTYPIVDPEIVVIATNPVGGVGIGVDPVDLGSQVFTFSDGEVPCHTVQNPFDFEYWDTLPGFDNHHGRSGTYTEDCGGAGGNICFAVNGAIDPVPGTLDVFGLFDLVSHEFGHCLTLGHVGDGAEGRWGRIPSNDIMAYSQDPPGGTKCVSTLDVESFALRMSNYLDANGDGAVNAGDQLLANDQIGEGGNPFQVQHPADHLYASSTGSPLDCPQPDLGPVPGAPTNWTPPSMPTSEPVLRVTGPRDQAVSDDGVFNVTGTVDHASLFDDSGEEPTSPTGYFDDADDDASSPLTEIKSLDVVVTDTHVDATISLAELWPSTDVTSGTSYSLTIDGRKFDSFVRYPGIDENPMTWDTGAVAYMPAGASTWDQDANTVSFHIPVDYLATAGIEAPYFVGSHANFGVLVASVIDDSAPEAGSTVGVTGARVAGLASPVTSGPRTVTFEREDGNTFYPEDSTLGDTDIVRDTAHYFDLDVPESSDIEITLSWTDIGGSDLDLSTTSARMSGSAGATQSNPEKLSLPVVKGPLVLRVEPFLVTDPVEGVTYTLTAVITPSADTDGDGVADGDDRCVDVPASGPNGCPFVATEHVKVYVDGVLAGTQDVDSRYGPDAFDIPVTVDRGEHQLRVVWEDSGGVVAGKTVTVTRGGDTDGDGVADDLDNCPAAANADQGNIDGDSMGDVCDFDMDGDGHSNNKERRQGTDPTDPNSKPRR